MKFGKLHDISEVDFSLPPTARATVDYLSNLAASATAPEVYLGCTGWSMKEWVGHVYPLKTKSKDFLYHYTRQFNTIELNTTHYRIPTLDMVHKWREESADDFHFCPKLPQTISHSRNLGQGSDQLMVFCDHIARLEEKLGCCFMQLPPYFDTQRFKILQYFVQHFPKHIPLAIELRHESWFQQTDYFEDLCSLFEEHGIATVITDVAGRRDVLHQRLTTNLAMIRFVGNGLHPTDYSRADAWVDRLHEWFEMGLSRVYFFPHEPDNLMAPDMVTYFYEQFEKRGLAQTRGPKLIDPDAGRQISLF
ncbi:MAG: DUF72 domain-containing protein [Bacteroidota bacterium]